MNHHSVDLTLAHQAMRREEAAAYRRSGAALLPRKSLRLSAVLSQVRRVERRVPAARPA
jgi:hypothetical protein